MKPLRIADLFCGAGGTSTGAIEAAENLGYRPQLTAINHWDTAIATHTANHPSARHLLTAIDNVNPRDLYAAGELDILWASPECTHHSIARGGKPINEQSRATAWCVVRWADAVQPSIILVENVPEFISWGGIGSNGRPLKGKRGKTFHAWITALESLGYRVDWRVLCAADYGDPTTRKRLFVQAVRGRRKIVWPEPTHARSPDDPDMFCMLQRWVAAREIIDWTLEGKSIYERKRPLSEKTMRRIMTGLQKFGLRPFIVPQSGDGARSIDNPAPTVTTTSRGVRLIDPYLVELRGTSERQLKQTSRSIGDPLPAMTAGGVHVGICEPFIVPNFGERKGQAPRVHSVREPLPAVTSHGAGAVVSPFLVQVAHGNGRDANGDRRRSRGVDQPLPTVCGSRGEWAISDPALLPQQSGGALRSVSEPAPTVATDGAIGLVEPYLVKFYGNETGGQSINQPLDTVTTKDRHALVRPILMVNGEKYLLDIRFRMLQPHELAGAQGFPRDYQFTGTKTEQVKLIGNAVPCGLARSLVTAVLQQ